MKATLILLLLATSALKAGNVGFDVNDVSFLLPLPSDGAGVERLWGLGSDGPPSLSPEDYLALVPSAKDKWILEPQVGSDGIAVGGIPNPVHEAKVFKVVAVRADPCAKDDPKIDLCRAELRLVLQPVTWAPDVFNPTGPKIVSTIDAALHLIYEVPFPLVPEFIAELGELRALARGRTSGKPLGVHPVLKEEGLQGPYGSRFRSLLTRYARFPGLRVATHMLTERSDRWFFFKTEQLGGRLVRQSIPFVEGMSQEVFSDGSAMIEVRNPSSSADNVNLIVDSVFGGNGKFFKLPLSQQSELVNAALRIDNPVIHTPATLDCVSCHSASRALRRAKLTAGFLNLEDGNPNRYRIPEGTTGTLVGMELDNDYSVRSFGYFFARASFTRGVVNDSARIADYMNRLVAVEETVFRR